MILAGTNLSFQESVQLLSKQYNKPPEQIYGWWKQYAADCQIADQSPVLCEFELWYQHKLTT